MRTYQSFNRFIYIINVAYIAFMRRKRAITCFSLWIILTLMFTYSSQIGSTSVIPAAPTAQNGHLTKLRGCLCDLMRQHPEGIPLSRMAHACPLLVHPEVLQPYPSIRHLLGSFKGVVRLHGIGVQTLILPPLAHNTDGRGGGGGGL